MPRDPFIDATHMLQASRLGGVLPLRYGRKSPPPTGYTGRGAPYPRPEQIEVWRRTGRFQGIALRLAPGLLGVDVDMYDGKQGRESYERLTAECGELPATWMVTSRDDGSGIRLFTVPRGVDWQEGQAGPGIELIHAGHRYIVAPPSVHPSSRPYRWIRPDGGTSRRPPSVGVLAALPPAWGRRLTSCAAEPQTTMAAAPAIRSCSTYATATFNGVIGDLARMVPGQGRNNALNRAAYTLGGLVAAGLLGEADVEQALYDAAVSCGHVQKHGPGQTRRTIKSGMRAGIQRPRAGAVA